MSAVSDWDTGIGFGPPVMTAVLSPMQGPIPNVVGLPYGRAPPLHFKAPNWHDMLKLMARMSGTRLEATVEAMAVVKTAMQLRVVVNFVKVCLQLASAMKSWSSEAICGTSCAGPPVLERLACHTLCHARHARA